jgi:hypothetical protein
MNRGFASQKAPGLVASLALVAAALFATAPPAAADPAADAVVVWNANAGEAAIAACWPPNNAPILEARLYAMAHIAIHDALNAIDHRFETYAYAADAPAGTSPEAAVAAAARDVMVTVLAEPHDLPFPPECLAAGIARVEDDYTTALAGIPEGAAKRNGIAVGRASAAAILAMRAGDGSDTPMIVTDWPQGTEPGEWRFVPNLNFIFAPGWRDVTPFVLRDSTQYLPRPPYDVTSRKYAADLNEVKRLGGDDVITPSDRTAEQTEIALFWAESSPLQWNRIARTVTVPEGLDLWENARLFALLNMALSDGYVATFEAYLTYNHWRPVTAIRLAATDGNPATPADPTWTPLLPTPPVPEHDSGHSIEGGAGARVLQRIFGNRTSFSTCSLTLPAGSTCDDPGAVYRDFTSFSQAQDENGFSRVLLGYHFRRAVDEGIAEGRRIGERAVGHFLRPLD